MMKNDITVAIAAPNTPYLGIKAQFSTVFTHAAITVDSANIFDCFTATKTLPIKPLRAENTADNNKTDEYSHAEKKSLEKRILAK